MAYTIITLGNYDYHHVYQLLVDESLDPRKILQELTNFYYAKYYQQLLKDHQFEHDLKAAQEQLQEFQHIADKLQSKVDHWSSLKQPEKGQYSAVISKQYNHQLRLIWNRFQESSIIRYDYQNLRNYNKLSWKTFGKRVQKVMSIINALKDQPDLATSRYAQANFNLAKTLYQLHNHWHDFIEACDNPLITPTTVQIVPTQEFIQQADYNPNEDSFQAPIADFYDPYDY